MLEEHQNIVSYTLESTSREPAEVMELTKDSLDILCSQFPRLAANRQKYEAVNVYRELMMDKQQQYTLDFLPPPHRICGALKTSKRHKMRTPEELAEHYAKMKFRSLVLRMLLEVRIQHRRPRIRGRIQRVLLEQQSEITGMRSKLQAYARESLRAERTTASDTIGALEQMLGGD